MTESVPARRPRITDVGIAVCTYRRPDLLRTLLASLAAQQQLDDDLRVVVAVVDNSLDGEGMAVVEAMRPSFPFELRSTIQPSPGISATRNRSLELLGRRDAYLFVDDDEFADPHWLSHVTTAAWRWDADIVGGPVLPEFTDDTPRWMVEGGFHERPRYPTGTVIGATATNNLLVRRAVLDTLDQPWFDRSFDLSGGGDTHFLERALANGHRAIWCDEAIVHERVPPSRATTAWLVRRKFRHGNSYVRVQRLLSPGVVTSVRLATKALVRLAGSAAVLPLLLWRPVPRVRVLRSIALAAGQLAALVRIDYVEYARPEGRPT